MRSVAGSSHGHSDPANVEIAFSRRMARGALGAAVSRMHDITLDIMELLGVLFDPAHAEHAGEGPPTLSGTMTHLQTKARRDHTHTRAPRR